MGKIMRRGGLGDKSCPPIYYNLSFTTSRSDVYITVALAMYFCTLYVVGMFKNLIVSFLEVGLRATYNSQTIRKSGFRVG